MKNRTMKVLLIEDNPADARLVQEMLSEAKSARFQLEWAERLSVGLDRLAQGGIDVVLLDLGLPDSGGINTFFKVHIKASRAAIVVLTCLDDEELAMQAITEGAQDYLVKGQVHSAHLGRAIQYAKQRRQAEEALHQRSRELATLNVIAESLSQSTRLNDVLQGALRATLEALDLPAGSIHLLDKDTGDLTLAVQRGLDKQFIRTITRVPAGAGVIGRAAQTGSLVMSMSMSSDEPVIAGATTPAEPGRVRSFVSTPLKSRGAIVGIISLASHKHTDFSPGETRLLTTVGEQVGVSITNAQLVEKARKLSITDGVTGLSNRRHFYEVLSIEMSRARRTGRPLSVVLVDLDGFRQYNELFGQTNGDNVLRSLGETLVSSLRKIDVVFRVGSDEFAVLFPATDSCRAKKAMKRIRLKWTGEHEAENQALDVPLSFSTGIAQFPENAQTSESLLFLADFALRQSKQNGGQRCTSASELGELPTPTPQWAGVGQL